ncbi:aminotransferase [Cerioporus squamosus]|nr:aminotransferase [Cerioporus squamosus]
MAISQSQNGAANGDAAVATPAELDASKLTINLATQLKTVPPAAELKFGQPYGPLAIDPASSCLQYATNVFEGMKAYLGPDGTPRLFRPDKNMQRMEMSAGRKLVLIEKRWIPTVKGHSLYIRPTIIGTRDCTSGSGGVRSATLYVILCPTGPYFRSPRPVNLLAVQEHLALNYAPTFKPQQLAAKLGYDQCLWLLGDKITEADDGDLDVLTPPLDGTILPGITRDSTLALCAAHPSPWADEGRLLEVFAVGTAVVVVAIGRIGYDGKDITLPEYEGSLGPVGRGLYDRLTDIQEGRFEWENWSVPCDSE